MTDTQFAYAILYLLTYRLAIIMLGGMSIYIGYRLFAVALSPTDTAAGSEMSGKIGEASFSLKNAAPGTFFAAFGAITTISILMASPPEFDFLHSGAAAAADSIDVTPSQRVSSVTLRGENSVQETSIESIEAILVSALDTSQRLLAANRGPAERDLYARLLFVTGDAEEAFVEQQDVIDEGSENPLHQQRLRAYRAAAR